MLKRLAIVGLLILVGGAWPQVPGNGSSQHDNAQDKQKTANLSKPVVVVDSPHSANNQKQASEKPAKYPWCELLAPANIPNWFLVVVGGITGWFVYKTLRAIKKQADIMETQANDARESGGQTFAILKEQTDNALISAKAATVSAMAAQSQIKMMKDKERARISVEIVPLDTLEFRSGSNQVTLRIRNFGFTHALNMICSGNARTLVYSNPINLPGLPRISFGAAYKTPAFDPLPLEFEDLDVPAVLLANSPSVETCVDFFFPDEWEDEIAMRPKIAIELRGSIDYEDVFGDTHVTKFSYDKRISKWGEVSQEGSAPIRHSSQWFKTIGSTANEAT